jgi:FlaA1/EpsC-like NDP-sugar epimerase
MMEQNNKNNKENQVSYLRFFAMIGTSMIIMYILMYVNSYQILDHAWFSETRLFMTMIMGGAMMAIMLFFMLGMYKNSKVNAAIFTGAALILLLSIWLVRSQITVDGVDYMEAMIPHHSIAILTSERAGIEDHRVRELADEIIEAQHKEIKEMEWLIEDIRNNGVVETEEEALARSVPEFSGNPE